MINCRNFGNMFIMVNKQSKLHRKVLPDKVISFELNYKLWPSECQGVHCPIVETFFFEAIHPI